MSKKYPGGLITKSPVIPSIAAASGIWSLEQALQYTKIGMWPGGPLAIEDVFSTYLYTGNNATQTITNGIDLAGKGGMVWTKSRTATGNNWLYSTAQGAGSTGLLSNTTDAITTYPTYNSLSSFNSNGFSLGVPANGNQSNPSGIGMVSWSFAQAAKFFKVAQVTVSGSNQTVDLSSLGTVGMVTVKRTDSASAWRTFHRSCTSGRLVYLNTTGAETTDGSITLSGTTLTLVQATIGNGTYIVYAWAHDTGADGLIQCGTFTGGTNWSPNFGWEPQFLLIKAITAAAPVMDWTMVDTVRGFSNVSINAYSPVLWPNLNSVEGNGTTGWPTQTGVYMSPNSSTNASGISYVYMAIRRGPMRAPTSASQLLTIVTGNAGSPAFPATHTVDAVLDLYPGGGYAEWPNITSRLTGSNLLGTNSAAVESSVYASYYKWDYQTGAHNNLNFSHTGVLLRRYPGVFDTVCFVAAADYSISFIHNLGVAPELVIIKGRGPTAADWQVWHKDLTANYDLHLNTTAALVNQGAPFTSTTTTFAGPQIFYANEVHVAYLFATLAGISKVFSYTGNGSSQTINCGFTTGARFIMIKRTDGSGDWYVWDSTRGIVAGNDPHLSLNTTAAEVTTDDSIDPDNSGFIVNQLAATNINVTSATYIYLSFA